MPFRINHIHVKAADPRKTADWWVGAFGFEILSDETRVFGDRFVRCKAQEGGMIVTFSNARTGETLGPGSASPASAWSISPSTPRISTPTSRVFRSSAPDCRKARPRCLTAPGLRS